MRKIWVMAWLMLAASATLVFGENRYIDLAPGESTQILTCDDTYRIRCQGDESLKVLASSCGCFRWSMNDHEILQQILLSNGEIKSFRLENFEDRDSCLARLDDLQTSYCMPR